MSCFGAHFRNSRALLGRAQTLAAGIKALPLKFVRFSREVRLGTDTCRVSNALLSRALEHTPGYLDSARGDGSFESVALLNRQIAAFQTLVTPRPT